MSEFSGFPKEMTRFFSQLKKNNNKEWFDAHKKDYEAFVKGPSQDFVVAMGERLRKISPGIQAIPKVNKSLFRLNRDTRFSHDKTPYKTNLGILFWEGGGKRMESSGFYFHAEEKKIMLFAGMHMMAKEHLERYREAVVDKTHGPKLRKALNAVSKAGYEIGGKHYKRVPRGYDPSHKNADLLLHNGLYATAEDKIPQAFFSEGLIDYAFNHYKSMAPLHRWLLEAVIS